MSLTVPSGCGTALVTPFRADGSLDEPALRSFVDWQVTSGMHFLIPCGTTGEASTLSDEEWLQVVTLTVQTVRGRVPVFAGCTHNSTAVAVDRAQRISKIPGLTGILTASPYYNKPSQEGQFQHFSAIARAIPLPIILYNIPGRTGVNLEPATVRRLHTAHQNIVAVKESSGNLAQISECITQARPGFHVLAGDDGVGVNVVELGGKGLVSVASNEIPAQMSQMIQLALDGDLPAARTIESRVAALLKANFCEPSPAPCKALLNLMGKMSDAVRLPIVPATPDARAKLSAIGKDLGLIP